MNRFLSFFSVFVLIGLTLLMSACGGGYGGGSSSSSAGNTVAAVVLFPNPSVSLNPGEQMILTANAQNSSGTQIFSQTITYASSDSRIQILTTPVCNNTCALLCAGTWDTTQTCVPATPGTAGITSNLTASAGGITSAATVAHVHTQIGSVTIAPVSIPAPGCVSQTLTQDFQATVRDINNNDITAAAGPLSWNSQNSSVATVPLASASTTAGRNTVTSIAPGQANITASIGSVTLVTSVPAVFKACLVSKIDLVLQNPSATTTPPEDTLNFHMSATGQTRIVVPTVTDSAGIVISAPTPTLTYISSDKNVAVVSGGGNGTVTGEGNGATTITAECLPNTCNSGTTVHVSSNVVNGTVVATPPAGNAYAACGSSSTPCNQNTTNPLLPQGQIIPINGTTLGTAVTLPNLPNSMVISQDGTTIYMGSTTGTTPGLMIFSTGTNALTATVTNAQGVVIGVSPNGGTAIVAGASDTYAYSGGTVTTLVHGSPTRHLVQATAAAFTPDGTKVYIAGQDDTGAKQLWIFSSGSTVQVQPLSGTPTDVAVNPSGIFAYVADNAVSAFETCDGAAYGGVTGSLSAFHLRPASAPDRVIATDGGSNLATIDVSGTPAGCPPNGSGSTLSGPTITNYAPSTGAFTDQELLVSNDGVNAIVVGGSNVLNNTIGSTASVLIPLAGGATATCSASNAACAGLGQSLLVYVGGSDSKVHVITLGATNADTAQVVTPWVPTFVVSKK